MDAVIDIGSNSVRLLLYKGDAVTPKRVATTVLSENLATTGKLNETAMARTKSAIADFCCVAKDNGADNIYIFATEAMRSATNGDEFRKEIERAVSLPVDVISGEVEAKLGLLGATFALKPVGEITVIDIGGASVEVVKGNADRITYARSLPLGARRLFDSAGSNRKDVEKFVYDHISKYGIVSGFEGVAIGGTATSLASMALKQKVYDPIAVHCHTLTLADLDKLIDICFSGADLCQLFPTLPPKRALIIGHGAIMLRALTEYLGLSEVIVSESDNLEGYLLLKKGVY